MPKMKSVCNLATNTHKATISGLLDVLYKCFGLCLIYGCLLPIVHLGTCSLKLDHSGWHQIFVGVHRGQVKPASPAKAEPARFVSTGASALHTLSFGFNPGIGVWSAEVCWLYRHLGHFVGQLVFNLLPSPGMPTLWQPKVFFVSANSLHRHFGLKTLLVAVFVHQLNIPYPLKLFNERVQHLLNEHEPDC